MDEYKINIKQLYAYVRRNQEVKVGIPKLNRDNGTETSNEKEIVAQAQRFCLQSRDKTSSSFNRP